MADVRETQFQRPIDTLQEAGVEFLIVGGVAANVHGSPMGTQDVDIFSGRSEENLRRLADALGPPRPYLRGAPPGLPFKFDVPTVQAGLNFTFVTDAGDLDLLGGMTGGGGLEGLRPHVESRESFGRNRPILSLPALIRAKRAGGRPKDLEAVAHLEAILAEEGEAGDLADTN